MCHSIDEGFARRTLHVWAFFLMLITLCLVVGPLTGRAVGATDTPTPDTSSMAVISCVTNLASATCQALSLDFPQMVVRLKLLASEAITVKGDTFQMWEDDSPIASYSVATSKPRQFLILLLDRSSSLERMIRDIKESAASFIKALPDDVKLSLISFASDVEIHTDFTCDKRVLYHELKGIRPWGGTTLYDGIYLACERLYADSAPQDLRTLVVFTDGRDETPALRQRMSIRTLEDDLKLAGRHNIRIITVGMGEEIDREVLKTLAATTNGWSLFAPTPNELYGVYSLIAESLRLERHFSLSYLSPNPDRDGSKRIVKVQATLPDGKLTLNDDFEVALGSRRSRTPRIIAQASQAPDADPDTGISLRPLPTGIELAPTRLLASDTANPVSPKWLKILE